MRTIGAISQGSTSNVLDEQDRNISESRRSPINILEALLRSISPAELIPLEGGGTRSVPFLGLLPVIDNLDRQVSAMQPIEGRRYRGQLTSAFATFIDGGMQLNVPNFGVPSVTTPKIIDNPIETRLKKIAFDLDDLPEEFLDPIYATVMFDPVIVVTESRIDDPNKEKTGTDETVKVARAEHTYNRDTYQRFNGKCPLTRLDIIEVRDNTEIMAKLETFVAEKETEYHSKTQSTSVNSETPIEVDNDSKRKQQPEEEGHKAKKMKR